MTAAIPTCASPETRIEDSARLAALAREALVAEAELTPKPGLVDRRGSGAHNDLSLDLMRLSAEVLEPFFAAMAEISQTYPLGPELRIHLGAAGREAERAMYATTRGVNTHKGAIWALGLLVAGTAHSNSLRPSAIAKAAGAIARIPDIARPKLVSHGDLVRNRYGVTGACGEAFADFHHVTRTGIPALRRARGTGRSESMSRLIVLLSIMTTLEDTCVLYRTGREGLQLVQQGARSVLVAGGPGTCAGDAAFELLDRHLIERQISPGGSADLLAATIFLDSLESSPIAVRVRPCSKEEPYGTD
jgi:triphosphoribosyl-dephospho-CoA synthase